MVIVIVKMMVYISGICHGLEVVDCGGGDGVSVYLAFSLKFHAPDFTIHQKNQLI